MKKIGILGCGRVSQRHMEVYQDELKNAQVVVACDIIREKADAVAKQLRIDAVYSMDELLDNDNIDTVVILTESGNHARHARQVLEAGKHAIVEKPAALVSDEILSLESLATEKGLMYAVIFQNRYNPAIKILKQTYDSGRFGQLILGTVRLRWCRYQDYYDDGWHGTWKMDGGVINQQAIHHIDALQWICGPVSEVAAAQANILNQLEAEDTTVAVVKFANGGLGVIEATTAARPDDFEASISVVAEKGTAVIDGIALNKIRTWQFVEPESDDAEIPSKYSQDVPTGYGLSHGPFLQEIIDRLNAGRTDPPISAMDGCQAVRVVHALYRSVETGGWVKLDDFPLSSRLGR